MEYRHHKLTSFAAAAADFRSGKRTPRDFLEACIARIEEHEPRIKAFVTYDLAAARKAADESTRRYRAGTPLSAVDGCPVAVKDIISTSDLPTQMNSPIYRGWQSGYDAACVHALRKGGAIVFGKTVTTEFAIDRSGPTTNPFDATRTPGGSSSGTAAAVGAGMLPVGLGTQTGGSTLRPASYCGAVGLKPTIGALHMGGVHPLSTTCDHLGVIGATLADVWLTASQISLGVGTPGYGFLDGASRELPAPQPLRKVVWLRTRGWGEIDAETIAAFDRVHAGLRGAGVEIMNADDERAIADFEAAVDRDVDTAMDIVAYEMKWPFEGYIARHPDDLGPRIRSQLAKAAAMSPQDYEGLLEKRSAAQNSYRELAAKLKADAFITLASSGPAPVGLDHTGSRLFLTPGSWLGVPGFALPLMQAHGLPFGLQLLGFQRQDGRLCAQAHWIEQLGITPV